MGSAPAVDAATLRGPYGAKSAGEVGIAPPAGAIANAVADALGALVYEAPLTPERILAALERAG